VEHVKITGPISHVYRLRLPLAVILEPHPDGVVARAPEFGIETLGPTRDQALTRLRYTIATYFDWLRTYKPSPTPGMRAAVAKMAEFIAYDGRLASHDRAA
jgi:hypothetical protein